MGPHRRLSSIASAALALPLLVWLQACGSSATSVTSPTTISRCAITVQPFDGQIPAQGGSGSLSIGAARDCTWTASVEGQWLSIKSANSGQGDGTVQFAAAVNPDPAVRRGAIVLNTQRAELTQAAATCEFSLPQSSANFGQAGGSGTVQVQASSAMCNWTASSGVDWISLRSPNGSGSAQLAFDVAATTGPPRTATLTIAGQSFTVTQAEGCAYTVSPTAHSIGSNGGTVAITIASAANCQWTATSNVPWITIQGSSSGSGSGSVALSVASTSGPTRTGTATIAGNTVTITQSPGCAYSISPDVATIPSAGGTGRVSVSVNAGCPWTASSNDAWLTIVGNASGNGNGEVQYSVAPTTSAARTGTMTVAGRTFTVNQGSGCAITLSASVQNISSAGGTGSVNVNTAAGCAWTAASNAPWIAITSGASGTGSGTVAFSVPPQSGPGRSGTLTIGGVTFTVNQADGCAFNIAPDQAPIAPGGGGVTVNVTASAGCTWTSTTNASWIRVTAGASGSGSGPVQLTVDPNAGAARSGTVTIAGRMFTANQASGCAYSIAPSSQNATAAAGSVQVAVTAAPGCSWVAISNVGWLTVSAGASGTGNGTVQVDYPANTGPARAGTVTIAGQTFTLTQDTGCSYVVAPDNISMIAAGGSSRVDVTAASSSCSWTAVSAVGWITVTAGATGMGNGPVDLATSANSGPGRVGTVAIAGRTVTITQDSGCTYALSATSQPAPSSGGGGSVRVMAGAGCPWTATSNVSWMTITGGSPGSGDGTVAFFVDVNGTGAPRSGTLTIANQIFTVNQN